MGKNKDLQIFEMTVNIALPHQVYFRSATVIYLVTKPGLLFLIENEVVQNEMQLIKISEYF